MDRNVLRLVDAFYSARSNRYAGNEPVASVEKRTKPIAIKNKEAGVLTNAARGLERDQIILTTGRHDSGYVVYHLDLANVANGDTGIF